MKNMIEHREVSQYVSGELAGSATAAQMPDVPCFQVWFKAKSGNPTFAYVGTSSAVTVPDATTDTTTGWELDAAEEIGPLPCTNLNIFWYICDSADDEILYLAAK
jgi:hypothetical protein